MIESEVNSGVGFPYESESTHSIFQITKWSPSNGKIGNELDSVEQCRKKQSRIDGYVAGRTGKKRKEQSKAKGKLPSDKTGHRFFIKLIE